MKDFNHLLSTMKESIATYDYYVDFKKVFKNVLDVKYNLNVLNNLLRENDFDKAFFNTLDKNPDVITVIPILLAVREKNINILDEVMINYNFNEKMDKQYYLDFIKKTGLINLFYDQKITNLVDYVTGVEVGLDTNARKNRSGKIMSKIVFNYLNKVEGITILEEATLNKLNKEWNLSLELPHKRFDFAVKNHVGHIFLIETNYYKGGGSKLNEICRSYTGVANRLKNTKDITFVWITDRKGWETTKNDLKEAYEAIEHVYNINDLEEGKLTTVFK